MSNNDDQTGLNDDFAADFDENAAFEDESSSYDDDFSEEPGEEEDWDAYEQNDSAEQDNVPPKKKSNLFNILLFSGAGLVGLLLLVFQFAGSSGTPAPSASVVDIAATEAQQPAPVPPPPALPETGFLNSDEGLKDLEEDMSSTVEKVDEEYAAANAQPPVLPASPQVGVLAPAELPAEPTDISESIEADAIDAAPSSRLPRASDIVKSDTVAQPQTNAVPPAAFNANDNASAALVEKIDALMDRLDRMEADINELKDNAQTPASSTADREKISDLTQTIETMQAKLSNLQKTSNAGAVNDLKPVQPQILGSPESIISPRPQAAPSATPKKQAAVSWVLKGAQPGQAMVARSGSSEMQTVSVGDTLPGLGRITDVSYREGRWVVQGTQGQIRQQ